MTPQQALQLLDAITDPRHANKLTRVDYANAQQALVVLAEVVAKATPDESKAA